MRFWQHFDAVSFMSAIDACRPLIQTHAPHDSIVAALLYEAKRLSVNRYSSLLFELRTPDSHLKQALRCSFLGPMQQQHIHGSHHTPLLVANRTCDICAVLKCVFKLQAPCQPLPHVPVLTSQHNFNLLTSSYSECVSVDSLMVAI